MYRQEVPQYGTLLDLVADINADVLAGSPERDSALGQPGAAEPERHGAIRLGTAAAAGACSRSWAWSLATTTCRSPASGPFCGRRGAGGQSLPCVHLRLELSTRRRARSWNGATSSRRALARLSSSNGTAAWTAPRRTKSNRCARPSAGTARATVTAETYQALHDAHRLIADVVCFAGPHINHLTRARWTSTRCRPPCRAAAQPQWSKARRVASTPSCARPASRRWRNRSASWARTPPTHTARSAKSSSAASR